MPKSKSKTKNKKNTARPINREVFPELNSLFYTANPAEFFNMQIDSMSLLMASKEKLAPICEEGVKIGSIDRRRWEPGTEERREKYVSSQSILVLHHAAETLLRMYFAHAMNRECPWFGIANMKSFSDFKKLVESSLSNGFDRGDVADVFLGGSNAKSAGIDLSDEKFNKCIDGCVLTLETAGNIFLEDAFLYNAAKHGLATVTVENAKVGLKNPLGDPLSIYMGDLSAYLHTETFSQRASGSDPKWYISYTGQSVERNISLINLMVIELSNLWSVAKRKYVRSSGELFILPIAYVEKYIYGPVVAVGNQMDKLTETIPTVREGGALEEKELTVKSFFVPEGWSADSQLGSEFEKVSIVPTQDSIFGGLKKGRKLLAFSPRKTAEEQ